MDFPVTRNEFVAQNESVRANTDALNALNKKMDIIIEKLSDSECHSLPSTFRRSGDEGSSRVDIVEVEQTHGEDRIEMEEITQKDREG